jgi:hypothetical protein
VHWLAFDVDGTTHLLFEPVELLEKLAALTPRPRINLILYRGVLAPHAGGARAWWRSAHRMAPRTSCRPTWNRHQWSRPGGTGGGPT